MIFKYINLLGWKVYKIVKDYSFVSYVSNNEGGGVGGGDGGGGGGTLKNWKLTNIYKLNNYKNK